MKDRLKVIGIGELLWDMLPEGKKLGGAPCNFAYHAMMQGASVKALSAIGDDDNGKEILEVLRSKDIPEDLIQVNNKPTGTVDVMLSEEGIPEYTIHENVAWDFISLDETAITAVSSADIVCFGSLAQRNSTSRASIVELLKGCSPVAIVACDINLRQQYYSADIINTSLHYCNVLKLNEEELPIVANLLGIPSLSEEDQIKELIDRYRLNLVALTKGSVGSLLVTPGDRSYLSTPAVNVKDTVGAGDSFTAVMCTGFASGEPLHALHKKAVDISAFVCTQDGAMPDYMKQK
jgi:fructokinase